MRKAQAAMEYLMTYGWAILIVVVVVAALYAMGVFKIGGKTVPCSPCFSNFAYIDYSGDTLIIRNGPRTIDTITVTGATPSTTTANPGDTITLTNSTWTTSGTYSITISYRDTSSGLTHSDSATLHS
jgi:hypothetical protein